MTDKTGFFDENNKAWARMTIQNAIIVVHGLATIAGNNRWLDISRIEDPLNIALWGSIFLVFGAVAYEYDADRKAKQTKRDEHERIDRLIEPDLLDETEMNYPPVYSHMIGGKR